MLNFVFDDEPNGWHYIIYVWVRGQDLPYRHDWHVVRLAQDVHAVVLSFYVLQQLDVTKVEIYQDHDGVAYCTLRYDTSWQFLGVNKCPEIPYQ